MPEYGAGSGPTQNRIATNGLESYFLNGGETVLCPDLRADMLQINEERSDLPPQSGDRSARMTSRETQAAGSRGAGPWLWLGPALAVVLARGIFTVADFPAIPPRAAAATFTVMALLAAWRNRRDAGEGIARDPAVLLLAAFLGALLTVLFSHGNRVGGDATHHYMYLVSIMEDGDLDFENNASDIAGEVSETFKHHSIGPALVWAPWYVLAELGSRLTGRPPDGWNALYRNAVAIGALLFGWSGLLALYLSGRRLTGRTPAFLSAIAIGGGTFLFSYLAFDPAMSHSSTFAGASWLVYWGLRADPLRPGHAFLLGVLLGFTSIQRWQAAVLALFVSAVFARAVWASRSRAWLLPALACLAGAVLLFLPQSIVWKHVFGAWLTIPQGPAFVGAQPRIEGVLFSPRHGLFSWSPVLYLALPGFVLWARRQPWLCGGALLTILATTRANAGLADWFGGSAFGARRFDLTLPFFGLALALVFDRAAAFLARRPHAALAAGIAAAVLWNSFFAVAYFSGRFPNSEPVPFVDQMRGVAEQVDATMGSPFSLPASLYRLAIDGVPLTAFEGTYLERPYSTITIRMGLEDRLFLDDGWSAPTTVDGADARRVVGPGAGVTLPIHTPRPYRLGLRCRMVDTPSLPFELWINDRRVGSFAAQADWASHEVAVDAEVLRAGRNQLRIVPIGAEGAGQLAVAGLWFERVP
jgi:hypothetical protein